MDHDAEMKTQRPGSRAVITFFVLAAVAAFFLLSEHRIHALGFLPWILLIAVCPLMHIFMHGGHGGHDVDERDSGIASPTIKPDNHQQ
jgi:nitrate reductase NapE component